MRGRRTGWSAAGIVLLAGVTLAMPALLDRYYLSLLTESLLYGIVALSLDLVWGYTGIPDLGHALWFGTGALSVGMMTTKLDPTGLTLGVYGGLGRHVAGIAIVTLALTVVAATIYGQTSSWTGGDNGLFGFAYHGFSGRTWYYISAALLVAVTSGALVLVRSDFGLVLRAIRDNERRVRFFGTNVEAAKLGVFVSAPSSRRWRAASTR